MFRGAFAPLGSPRYHALITPPSQFLAPECSTGFCERTCPCFRDVSVDTCRSPGRGKFQTLDAWVKILAHALSGKVTLDLNRSMRFPHASVSSLAAQEKSTDLRVTTRTR